MSLRPIEMQGQIPRTQNIGKIQDQLQQRGQVSQEVIANEQKKEADLKRKQVQESDDTERLKFETGEQSSQNQSSSEEQKKQKKQSEEKIDHPYKGKFIDFSG